MCTCGCLCFFLLFYLFTRLGICVSGDIFHIYIYIYIYIYIQCNWKKTHPWLNCRYKFISAKNIIFVSSDDIHEFFNGGARGVMVIVVGNGHSDTSSNPGRN